MKNIIYIFAFILISCSSSDDNYQPIDEMSGNLTIYVSTESNSYNSIPSNSDYYLSGKDINGTISGGDPNITFSVGEEISFDISASGHPFFIKTEQVTGTQKQVSNVINNGETNGVIRWTPSEKGIYYYQCSVHNGMHGIITIVD